jgi:hypothetical protein
MKLLSACFVSTCLLSSGVSAQVSDFNRDLAKPHGYQMSPLSPIDRMTLAPGIQAEIREVVSNCIYLPYAEDETGTVFWSPPKSRCPDTFHVEKRDPEAMSSIGFVKTRQTTYQYITWNSQNCDVIGCDDMAIYDAQGNRIGVYINLYYANGPFDDLGGALDVKATRKQLDPSILDKIKLRQPWF